jgi:hypothetical protein
MVFLFRSEFVFRTTRELEYPPLPQNLTLGYMTKTLNQIIFFPPPKSEYFFQQHWESELELKHQGKTSNDTIDKANALNNQFQSVFTEDSENIMPEIGGKRYNTMNDINITLNGVTKLLKTNQLTSNSDSQCC